MRSRKIKTIQKNKPAIKREREPLPRKYVFLSIVCGLLLVLGFFGAARQHFASIDFGIKNAKLKKEIETLKSEQRRLQLNREIALSPPEIKKLARKIGFREMTANNIQSFQPNRISIGTLPEIVNERSVEVSLAKPEIEDPAIRERIKPIAPKNAVVETKKSEPVDDKSKKS